MKVLHIKVILISILATLIIVGGLLVMQNWEDRMGQFSPQDFENTTITHHNQTYVLNENIETFLVIGLDKYTGTSGSNSYNNDKQADFLLLFVLDNETKQCHAIQINRDTMAEINVLGVAGNKVGTVNKQISLAHTYGNGQEVSCRNTADAVSKLLMDMKVNHYISVTMDVVAQLNDLVGGVEVEVLDDFSGIDDTLIKGQRVTLKGEQALTYIRARQNVGDSTNTGRMKRQAQYIEALYEKIEVRADESQEFLKDVSLEVAEHMISDRSVTQLQGIAEKIRSYEFTGIHDIQGTTIRGEEFMEFHPNEDALKELIVDMFYRPETETR